LNDITPRVNAEEALTLELRRKKDFIDVASHELRTPLQLVLGYLDVMLAFPDKYGLNDEGTRFQGLILDSAKREERIVNRMLEYSIMNVEGEEIRPENRSFSPQSVVDVIPNARKIRSDAEVEVAIPADLTIESDPDFFYNILAEFCTNAIQYSVPPRKITITGSQDELQSCFSVKDNGNGMTADVKNSLFKPFFIGDGTQLSRK